MKRRCRGTSGATAKQIYHGRGIRVCDEWQDSFVAFCDWSLANGYRDDLQIDRIDNDGGYTPDNCRWVTSQVNCNNKRNNRLLAIEGETKTVTEWSRDSRSAVGDITLTGRLNRGWSSERAVRQVTTDPVVVDAWGEMKTPRDWSRDARCVVRYKTLWRRLDAGWDTERAISEPENQRGSTIAFGERKSIAAWSRDSRCVVGYGTLHDRIRNGWAPEDAISLPPGGTVRVDGGTV